MKKTPYIGYTTLPIRRYDKIPRGTITYTVPGEVVEGESGEFVPDDPVDDADPE